MFYHHFDFVLGCLFVWNVYDDAQDAQGIFLRFLKVTDNCKIKMLICDRFLALKVVSNRNFQFCQNINSGAHDEPNVRRVCGPQHPSHSKLLRHERYWRTQLSSASSPGEYD